MSLPSEPPGFERPTVAAIFFSFLSVSAMGFGGVIPWARWLVVERRKWLTPAEFNEVMTLSQMLPGGNIMNMSIVLGQRFRGLPGAIAGIVGLIAAPFIIVIGLALVYDRIRDVDGVGATLEAVSAAAAGLILAMAVKMALTLKDEPLALVIAAVSFTCIGLLRFPLVTTLFVLGPLSIAFAWYRLAKAAR